MAYLPALGATTSTSSFPTIAPRSEFAASWRLSRAGAYRAPVHPDGRLRASYGLSVVVGGVA